MPEFIKGRELSARFYEEIAAPILRRQFPELPLSAGFLGYGSDVLGYDDPVSTDHMWGPRFYLFLREEDFSQAPHIMRAFSENFPVRYLGYCVHFSEPDPNDNGVRHPEPEHTGPVSPLVFIHTVKGYLQQYLGTGELKELSPADWLSFSEHRLLALRKASFFRDDLGFLKELQQLHFYPEPVLCYLLASNWSLIAEEQAFVRRCADVGDETGSMLACARIAERLMRLVFLYCGEYAPYSKWFGTAFSRLPADPAISEAISGALSAREIGEREELLVQAQILVAGVHNASGLTSPVEVRVQNYFGRNIRVIFADRIAQAIASRLQGTPLSHLPLIGTLSGVANFTAISDSPKELSRVKALYL
ncbi:MAG: DUF4037 domain-containing protein [Provencibacterium sp.]|jgi:hypothetical protein|nr:DUF4037 domain-containing protein [Provencibacterium sp.]